MDKYKIGHRITDETEYYEMIKDINFTEENKRLIKMYQNTPSEEIMSQILTINEGLVLNLIEPFKKILMYVDTDDLYEEAMIGLMKAVDKYDTESDCSFSTYANYWIKQVCSRYLKKHNRMIKIPEYLFKKLNTASKYMEENGCDVDEACKQLGYNPDVINMSNSALKLVSSLNTAIFNEDEQPEEFINIVASNEESMEDKMIRDDIRERVNTAINQLKDREQYIVKLRFGFIDGIPHTLDDISALLGLSRERIRVINNNALKKMSKMKVIKGYAPEKEATNS